jgi:predicted RNA-binding protein with PIN domain
MMHYILDANNLMYKDRQLHSLLKTSLDYAQTALIKLINDYAARYKKYRITVVFDGSADVDLPIAKNVFVKSSGSDLADSLIKELVRIEENPRLCTVVSSDMEVYNYARLNSCQAVLCEQFLSELLETSKSKNINAETDSEKPAGVSKKEIRRMKELFGVEDKPERRRSRKPIDDEPKKRSKRKKKSDEEIIQEEIPDAELLKLKKRFEK